MNEKRLASGRLGPSHPLLMPQQLAGCDRCIGHAAPSSRCIGQASPGFGSGAFSVSWHAGGAACFATAIAMCDAQQSSGANADSDATWHKSQATATTRMRDRKAVIWC